MLAAVQTKAALAAVQTDAALAAVQTGAALAAVQTGAALAVVQTGAVLAAVQTDAAPAAVHGFCACSGIHSNSNIYTTVQWRLLLTATLRTYIDRHLRNIYIQWRQHIAVAALHTVIVSYTTA